MSPDTLLDNPPGLEFKTGWQPRDSYCAEAFEDDSLVRVQTVYGGDTNGLRVILGGHNVDPTAELPVVRLHTGTRVIVAQRGRATVTVIDIMLMPGGVDPGMLMTREVRNLGGGNRVSNLGVQTFTRDDVVDVSVPSGGLLMAVDRGAVESADMNDLKGLPAPETDFWLPARVRAVLGQQQIN